jgi:hypothetical protein
VDWEVEEGKVPRIKESRKISETILRNVRVLAVNQNADKEGKATKKPKSATLEVSEKQAEILANSRRMGKLFLALRSHVPSEVPRQDRNYEFTSDLEILSSLRGGLVSHIVEQNFRAIEEFDLKRWIEVPDGARQGRTKPQAPVAPMASKPRIKIQSPALKPATSAPSASQPLAAKPVTGSKSASPAAGSTKAPASIVSRRKKAVDKPDTAPVLRKAEQPKVKPAPAPVVVTVPAEQAEPKTVRVDRAGKVQTLKFKEAQ